MLDRLKIAIWGLLAAISPIKAVLLTTLGLVVVDLVTGVLAAYKRKEPIASGKLKRTVVKLLAYELTILASYAIMVNITGEEVPIMKIAASIIALTELRSVLENLSVITGDSIFSNIVGALPLSKRAQSKQESDQREGN